MTDDEGNPHPNQPIVEQLIDEYLKSCQELLDLIPDDKLLMDPNDAGVFTHTLPEITSIATYLVIEEELYDLPMEQLVMMVRFTLGFIHWAGYFDNFD